MTSVNKDAKGWRVLFVDADGKRRSVRLTGIPKMDESKAKSIGERIDRLNGAKCSGSGIDGQTASWLANIGQTLHDKLSRAGLVEARSSATLKEFMAEYIADARTTDGRPAAKNTLKKWTQAEKVLVEYFENRNLREISHDEVAKFRRWLDAGTLGENGIRTHMGVAKMFLNVAKRRKLVEENPFEFEKSSLVIDRSRDFFLTRANALKIIDACPDSQWRLIVALWRFAGLRKMEIFQLHWEHVLWDQGRMLVTIPKTKHHEGKESRFVPIGDILPWLEKEFHEAPEGSQRLITRFAASNENLAKPFEKIITMAGLTPWPKLIQNLRASCETAWLDDGIPAHVVAKWIGHSVKVQNDNYAQVDDHHFDQFNASAREAAKIAECATETESDDENEKVAHQVAHAGSTQQTQSEASAKKKPRKTGVLRGSSQSVASLRCDLVPEAGVEPAHGITHTGF